MGIKLLNPGELVRATNTFFFMAARLVTRLLNHGITIRSTHPVFIFYFNHSVLPKDYD